MSFLETLRSRDGGSELVSLVIGIIELHGGLQGIVSRFERTEFSSIMHSWISNGPNQSISTQQVHEALGTESVQRLAKGSGLSVQEVLVKLASGLPQAVDKLTPTGTLQSR